MTDSDIYHAWENSIGFYDIDTDTKPVKSLCIGPDKSGNLIEILFLQLEEENNLIIHAMPLRPIFETYLTD